MQFNAWQLRTPVAHGEVTIGLMPVQNQQKGFVPHVKTVHMQVGIEIVQNFLEDMHSLMKPTRKTPLNTSPSKNHGLR